MNTSSGNFGRPKCGVWEYFRFDEQAGNSICIVKLKSHGQDGDVLCNKTFKGKFTTNLKVHLKKEHSEEYRLVLDSEKKKRKEKGLKKLGKDKQSSTLLQSTLPDIGNQKKKYEPHNTKQKSITKKLVVFVGASNVPISLVENGEFKELLYELDSRYQVPGRFKIAKELDMLYSNMKIDLRESLSSAERISLCVDAWSKRGMSASFLGLTAHFYSRSKKDKCNITIAVRRFESPHTAERVSILVNEIANEWKIPYHKIFRILTDNGSNMIAAFKGDIHLQNDDDQEFEDGLATEVNGNSSDSENEDNEEENFEEAAFEDDTSEEPCLERIQEDYDECETQHDIALAMYQRVSCFAHTLQLSHI